MLLPVVTLDWLGIFTDGCKHHLSELALSENMPGEFIVTDDFVGFLFSPLHLVGGLGLV